MRAPILVPLALLVFGGGLLVSLSSCGPSKGGAGSSMKGAFAVDGSSTVYPIAEAVQEEFIKKHPRVRVGLGKSGTGGGFKRFVRGETAVSNASRPIKKSELDAAKAAGVEFVELVVAYDGITFVVNKANDWCDDLTVADLKRIFLDPSQVRSWRDIRKEWPDEPLTLYIPGTDSGTFDYFREIVVGDGSIRGDVTPSEEDNVLVTGVIGDRGGLAFFGCAYYFKNQERLKALKIEGVEPTTATIESGEYAPFSRPLFVYANKAKLERPEVRSFLEFFLEEGGALAEEVGYVKLPAEITQRARKNLDEGRTGSQYLDEGGKHKVGPVHEIYR